MWFRPLQSFMSRLTRTSPRRNPPFVGFLSFPCHAASTLLPSGLIFSPQESFHLTANRILSLLDRPRIPECRMVWGSDPVRVFSVPPKKGLYEIFPQASTDFFAIAEKKFVRERTRGVSRHLNLPISTTRAVASLLMKGGSQSQSFNTLAVANDLHPDRNAAASG